MKKILLIPILFLFGCSSVENPSIITGNYVANFCPDGDYLYEYVVQDSWMYFDSGHSFCDKIGSHKIGDCLANCKENKSEITACRELNQRLLINNKEHYGTTNSN